MDIEVNSYYIINNEIDWYEVPPSSFKEAIDFIVGWSKNTNRKHIWQLGRVRYVTTNTKDIISEITINKNIYLWLL